MGYGAPRLRGLFRTSEDKGKEGGKEGNFWVQVVEKQQQNKRRRGMTEEYRGDDRMNEALANAMAEANRAFDQIRAVVEEEVGRGATQLDVAEIARRSGLEIEAATLDDLRVDRVIHVLPWLPWHEWFPWRPLWCWWWGRYPWYRCCPWWWYRCHWYPW
jgi:hypothetical protein